MREVPSLFWVVFVLLWTSTPGSSHGRDTQKCYEDKGLCHPTLCPAQTIEKGTCYFGSQLCCIDCPSHFLSYEGTGTFSPPHLSFRTSVKILLSFCWGKGIETL